MEEETREKKREKKIMYAEQMRTIDEMTNTIIPSESQEK